MRRLRSRRSGEGFDDPNLSSSEFQGLATMKNYSDIHLVESMLADSVGKRVPSPVTVALWICVVLCALAVCYALLELGPEQDIANSHRHSLHPQLQVLDREHSEEAAPESIVKGELDHLFVAASDVSLAPETRAVYWFKGELSEEYIQRNQSPIIEYNESLRHWSNYSLELYVRESLASGPVARTGYAVAQRENRELSSSGFTLPFGSLESGPLDYYIRVDATANFYPAFYLWDNSAAYLSVASRIELFFFSSLCVIIAMAIYNTTMLKVLPYRVYGYFIGYLLMVTMVMFMAYQAQQGALIWPNRWLSYFAIIVTLSLTYVFIIQFTRQFLDTKNRLPRWDHVLKGVIILSCLPIVLFFLSGSEVAMKFQIATGVFRAVAANLVLLIVCLVAWRKSIPNAKLLGLSFVVLLILGSMRQIARFGFINYSEYPYSELNLSLAAIALQCVVISFAIANRMRLIEVERTKAQLDVFEHLKSISRLESEAKRRLEEKVEEKTRSLQEEIGRKEKAEAALAIALEKADSGSRAKSDFLASMSHELRTPLNAILGYAQILKKEKSLGDKNRKGVEVIERSGDHLLALINDVLDLSRIEAGKWEIRRNEFCIETLVANIMDMFSVPAQRKGLKLELAWEISPSAYVLGDERQVRQILVNLLGNAIKFTHEGKVTIRIQYLEYGADHIRFEIEDTGSGISEEKLEEIFQPFRQADLKREAIEGTGLGLSISRKLARLMGGELSVVSELGKGSVFRFDVELPLLGSNLPSRSDPRTIVGYIGERRRLLVVDDRQDNRDIVTSLLQPLGFEVLQAENGKQAIELSLESKPDVALLDLVMPVMDGFEATRRLRQISSLDGMKIIASSASVFDENREQSLIVGCDDFVPKPIKEAELLEALRKHLGLEWICEDREMRSEKSLAAEDSLAAGDALPLEIVELLRESAEIGDVSACRRILEGAGEVDNRLLDTIESHLSEFDLESIVKLLDRVVPRAP